MKRRKKKIAAMCTAALMSTATVFMPASTASAVNFNIAMSYYVYDADGDYLRQYTLSASPTLTAGPSTYAVIDDDSRVVDFSKSGVVKLMSTTAEGGFVGTGFIVDAHTIATAAHCVSQPDATFTQNCGNEVDEILIFDGDGDAVETVTSILSIHIPVNYANNAWYCYDHLFIYPSDYALITVSDDLSDYACFNLGVPLDGLASSGTNVSVTGFPSFINNTTCVNTATTHNMYTGTGTLSSLSADRIRHEIDSSNGNSGGPIYITTTFQNKTYCTVIGIHTFTDNILDKGGGMRMNTNLLQFYKNNPNL